MIRSLTFAALTLAVLSAVAADDVQTAPSEPSDMKAIFNGKDLTGWDGDTRLWSVKDGAIRGETTDEIKANGNTFIIWQAGRTKDFELRLSFRCNATNNSGIQYRSKHITDGNVRNKWVVRGYQHEIRNENTLPSVSGFIYDEGGKRGRTCLVGEKATWGEDGKKVTGQLIDAEGYKKLFKLEKLKIHAYRYPWRPRWGLVGTFEAMFNPASFKQKYAILYGKGQGLNSTAPKVNYAYSEPMNLSLTLLLDGTGVNTMGVAQLLPQKSVPDRVKEFLDLTFHMDGKIHEPHYLKVEWGDLIFPCRLSSVDINYTSFDRSGHALRAELTVALISDEETEKRMRKENKTSPDLTHSRIVKSGDTLPLLSREVYGSTAHYLRVAQFNRLDGFRNLSPGQEILFPPLEK